MKELRNYVLYICMYVCMYRYGDSVFHLVSGYLLVKYVYQNKMLFLLTTCFYRRLQKYHFRSITLVLKLTSVLIGYTNNKPYARSIKF